VIILEKMTLNGWRMILDEYERRTSLSQRGLKVEYSREFNLEVLNSKHEIRNKFK
jgi:hypothetical protein